MAWGQGSKDGKIMGVIYKITAPDGKYYIGQTRNFERRMEAYKTLQCSSQPLIYKSLKKYGFNNHIVSILCEAPLEDIERIEIELIVAHKSCYRDNPLGLNVLKESYEEYKKIKHKIPSYKSKRKVRRIIQSTIWGDEIKIWDSAYRAAKDLGFKRREILKAVRSKSKYYQGYNWTYER